jgi:hypothetical protein
VRSFGIICGDVSEQNLVDLSRVAQDGTRVRASAGAASLRSEQTLHALMTEARAHLEQVTREAADPAITARRAAAIKRGAKDRLARLEAALEQLPQVIETKKHSGAKDTTPRVSSTDPDARVMKMGDGGSRPADNLQFPTTADAARVIVGVAATNRGSDQGESTPMLEQIVKRTGVLPDDMLLDGGYNKHDAIDEATKKGVTVYAPVPKPRKVAANALDPTCRAETLRLPRLLAIRIFRSTPTARPWLRGANGWGPTRRERSTNSAVRSRRPSTPTPRRIEGSIGFSFAACPRPWASPPSSPSLTTFSVSSRWAADVKPAFCRR